MKLNTAFKFSALAVALASTSSVFAATTDTSVINDAWTDPSQVPTSAVDNSAYQYVDVGSNSTPNTPSTGNEVTGGILKYEVNVGSTTETIYSLRQTESGEPIYYSKDATTGAFIKLEDQSVAKAKVQNQKSVLGGQLELTENVTTTNETVKRLDSNTLTYSEKVTNQDIVTVDSGALINSDATQTETVTSGAQLAINDPKVISEQSVKTGIIAVDKDNNNVYGYEAKSKTFDENGKAVEHTTTVKADSITTTGKVKSQVVEADKITLGGKDLQETLTAEETARKDADVVLQNNINAEEKARTDADVVLQNNINAEEKARTDADVVLQNNINAEEKARTDADVVLQNNINVEEKARTDADAVLDERISTNTDDISKNTTAIAGFDSRISDLNTRTNQLNKRVDEVEKTAYRGVAIALAAQQNVPNIKPGQFAVFGGVGHYESESAFAMGVVGSINERTSISGAIGVAGGSEVGGRVGVAYVFGGK